MKLELHPQAVLRFDEIAASLLTKIIVQEARQVSYSYRPEVFLSVTLTGEDIVDMPRQYRRDGTGKTVGRYFQHNGKEVGLFGPAYEEFVALSAAIQQTPAFRRTISLRFLEDVLFDWCRAHYLQRPTSTLCEYVLRRCQEEVREYEIWIPIAMLYVEAPFELGGVTVRSVTQQMIDSWEQEEKQANPEESVHISHYFEKRRKQLQGYAAGVVPVVAELEMAGQIAQEETERAIAMLRVFSPANLSPRMKCFCMLRGKENLESITTLGVSCGRVVSFSQGYTDPLPETWAFTNNELALCRQQGLDIASQLLREEKKSEFQKAVFDSLLLYSRSSTFVEPADKLVYILAALEGILIKGTEPIQQNLGERMAMLVGKSLEERKRVIANLKEVYKIRSAFIHHAQTVSDTELLSEFMPHAAIAIITIMINHTRFSTKDKFIQQLDDAKFV